MEEIYAKLGELLGMAVDGTEATGEWLQVAVGQYATMKVATHTCTAAFLGLLIILAVIATVVVAVRMNKARIAYENRERGSYYSYGFDYEPYIWVIAFLLIVVFVLLFFCAIDVKEVVKWSVAPDAAMLDTVIHAIKG